ncbi:MAG: hypothetical protein ACNYPD_06755 [Candidatus Halichondribacter symbioticus]
MTKTLTLIVAVAAFAALSACKKEEPPVVKVEPVQVTPDPVSNKL